MASSTQLLSSPPCTFSSRLDKGDGIRSASWNCRSGNTLESNFKGKSLFRLKLQERGNEMRNRNAKSFTNRISCSVWQDNSARVDVDVPIEKAWLIWEDRESIPNFMPWIHTVKVSKDDPSLSVWNLQYEAFGQQLSFSWTSKNLKPTLYQKIHWRAVDGLANKGAVRFVRKGNDACSVELTISYEVPEILSPFALALAPLVEQIIMQDMQRFATYAKNKYLSNA